MTPTQWILLVVAIVVIIALLFVVGYVRRKNQRISFAKEDTCLLYTSDAADE